MSWGCGNVSKRSLLINIDTGKNIITNIPYKQQLHKKQGTRPKPKQMRAARLLVRRGVISCSQKHDAFHCLRPMYQLRYALVYLRKQKGRDYLVLERGVS